MSKSTVADVDDLPAYLTVPELAFHLRISRAHAYRLLSGGNIASVTIGRCRRISRAAVRDFESGLTGGTLTIA